VDDGSIDNAKLAGEIKKYQDNVKALSFTEASEYLQEETMAGGVVLTLGAGEAYKVGDSLLGK
jgi:UDP-N-acetylmuramate-alanine ligase